MKICESLLKLYPNGYLRLFSLKCNTSGVYPPLKGSKIIAANHPNATDSFHLIPVLEETPHFLMRSMLFSKPVIGWLLKKAGQIEVSGQGRRSFEQACALLRDGQTIVIYPEGRLNPRYEKLKVKTGAVRLSLVSGAPIIPLGISFSQKTSRICARSLMDISARVAGKYREPVTYALAHPGYLNSLENIQQKFIIYLKN